MSSLPNPRRSFSLPVHQEQNFTNRSRSSTGRIDGVDSEDNIELLFSHNSARIIHFTASRSGVASGKSGRVEALPYRSPTERTLASGPIRVYRVKFQCAFISSGSILHPLLPKSAAWCVDETDAIFVLRIRQHQYWRLELIETELASILVEELKDVLDSVCYFERLPCPFRALQISECEVDAPLPVFSKRQFSANRAKRGDDSTSLPSSLASSVDEQHMFPMYMGEDAPSSRSRMQKERRESLDVHTPLENYKLRRGSSSTGLVSAQISAFEIRAKEAGSNPSSYGSSVNSGFKLVHDSEPKSFTNGHSFTGIEHKFTPGRLKPRTEPANLKTFGSSAPSAIETNRSTTNEARVLLEPSIADDDDVFSGNGKAKSRVPEPKSAIHIPKMRKKEDDGPVIGPKLPTLQTKAGESSISAALNSPVRQATPTKRKTADLFNMAHSSPVAAITTRGNVQNYMTSSPAAAICFGLKSPDRNAIMTPRSGVIRIPKRKQSPAPIVRPMFDLSDIDDYPREDNKYLSGNDAIKSIDDDDSSPEMSGLESDSESEDWSYISQPSSPAGVRRRRAGTTGSILLPSDSAPTPVSPIAARHGEGSKHKRNDSLILARDANNSRLTLSNLAHKATTMILNKTLDLAFMRPSSYLATIMLRIAARVAAGTVVYTYYWADWTKGEEGDIAAIDPIDDDEFEDDFGVKLVGRRKDRFAGDDDDERIAQGVNWSRRGRRGSAARIPG